MSKGGKEKDVFEVGRIRQIIELMKQHDLSEVDLQQGDEKIKLCRGSAGPPVNAAPVAIAPASASTAPAPPAPTDADDEAGTITINSPMVGTFYARPNPESQPFVKVGDSVDEDTVVCIVEAMKVFNEIPAECSGEIVQVLVKDQEPVDHGKPLFRVRPNG